jgi:hypothetical protein
MEKMRYPYRFLVGRRERKRPLGIFSVGGRIISKRTIMKQGCGLDSSAQTGGGLL